MPNTKSAKKYMKQTDSRTSKNNVKKRAFRKAIRETNDLLKDGGKEDAKKTFSAVQKTLDKAVKANVLSKNTASRKKSRLSKKIKGVK